jgi:hypothetical protein
LFLYWPKLALLSMKNKTMLRLLAALSVVIINGLIGHFFAPYGILLTPIILSITTYLAVFPVSNLNPVWKSMFSFLFIATNDISIKLYSGGRHDYEGLAWVHLLLFIGLLPVFGLLLNSVFEDRKAPVILQIFAMVIFPILILGYLYFFSELGLGREYPIN